MTGNVKSIVICRIPELEIIGGGILRVSGICYECRRSTVIIPLAGEPVYLRPGSDVVEFEIFDCEGGAPVNDCRLIDPVDDYDMAQQFRKLYVVAFGEVKISVNYRECRTGPGVEMDVGIVINRDNGIPCRIDV